MGSVTEFDSAFGSAAGEDLAAVRGLHSLAEAVLFLALELLGLVGTKHVFSPFRCNTQHQGRNLEVVDKKSTRRRKPPSAYYIEQKSICQPISF